jgi:hypothetical protein
MPSCSRADRASTPRTGDQGMRRKTSSEGRELLALAFVGASWASCSSCSCSPPAPLQAPARAPAAVPAARSGVDQATWQRLRDALANERASRPTSPWAAGLRMTLHEPRSGQTVDGRGAIAVAPGRALRMILVGPAGMTTLDAWVTPERWRLDIPPAGRLRRGAADAPAGLPVAFLRWLFFRPLEGTLFGGSQQGGRVRFLIRDGDAVLEVDVGSCDRGELAVTTRRSHGRSERLEECRAASVPTPGDRVRYRDEATGLGVELELESVAREAPAPDAFVDPDGQGAPGSARLADRVDGGAQVRP